MWRHYRERGGIAVYSLRIVENLLRQDSINEYVLFLPPGVNLGPVAPNVRVIEIGARTRWTWDQRAVPAVAQREGLDLVFNPKLSVPLRGNFRTVFMLHGMEQFVEAEVFPPLDRLYVHAIMPRYCHHADAILCPSHTVKAHIVEYLGIESGKIHVTPHGLDHRFAEPVTDSDRQRVRARYRLPDQYLLFVGGLTPLKNLQGMLRAMGVLKSSIPHQLVLSGFDRWKSGPETKMIRTLGLRDRVVRIGWVASDDQPALYAMATALLFPSLYEGFGLPVIEAMASGCPVITSSRGALAEVAGESALLVDPLDPQDIADAVERVVGEPALAASLVERGRRRAAQFDWHRTAAQVLEIFERAPWAAAVSMPRWFLRNVPRADELASAVPAYGQRIITTWLRSLTLRSLLRASPEIMKPTSSPDFGFHDSIGSFLVCGPMLSRVIPLQIWPDFSHS